jgi:hypothetical protein
VQLICVEYTAMLVQAFPPIETVVVPPFTPETPITIAVPPAVLPVLGVTVPVSVKVAAA